MNFYQTLKIETLKDLFKFQDIVNGKGKKEKMDFQAAISLVKNIANTKTNALEATPLQFGIADDTSREFQEDLAKILQRCRFLNERKKASKYASVNGYAHLAFVPTSSNNLKISDFLALHVVEETSNAVMNDYSEFIGNLQKYYTYGNDSLPVKFRYWKEENFIKYQEYVDAKDENGEPIKHYLTPTPIIVSTQEGAKIPVNIILNNEDRVSDIEYGCAIGLLSMYNDFVQDLYMETKYIQTTWMNNENFSDLTPKQLHEQRMNGERVINDQSFNSKVQQGVYPMQFSSQTLAAIQMNIGFIEDKILKACSLFREASSSGKNQHNLEIATVNQQATEALLSLADMRQLDYQDLIDKFSSVVGKQSPLVVFKISQIEQIKIENSLQQQSGGK